MNRIDRLMAVGVLSAAALGVSGCATEQQVDGQNIVNCVSGPTSKEVTLSVLIGNRVLVGGTGEGGAGHNYTSLTFEKGGLLSIDHDERPVSVSLTDSQPQLSNNEVAVDKQGVIFLRSDGIHYQIKPSLSGTDTVSLDVTATCEPQS